MVAKKSKKQEEAKWNALMKEIAEAKKDPEFMKDLRKFIKYTS
jgi:hypothetical protein